MADHMEEERLKRREKRGKRKEERKDDVNEV
jgi:hypothetical protein